MKKKLRRSSPTAKLNSKQNAKLNAPSAPPSKAIETHTATSSAAKIETDVVDDSSQKTRFLHAVTMSLDLTLLTKRKKRRSS